MDTYLRAGRRKKRKKETQSMCQRRDTKGESRLFDGGANGRFLSASNNEVKKELNHVTLRNAKVERLSAGYQGSPL